MISWMNHLAKRHLLDVILLFSLQTLLSTYDELCFLLNMTMYRRTTVNSTYLQIYYMWF
jgi:hypothetical protein